MRIAVYPWQLEIADPDACELTDTILSVHHERGSVTVRLTRFTLQTPVSHNGHPPLTEGALVGLRAARQNVNVLPPAT